jgi:hypothetical protein
MATEISCVVRHQHDPDHLQALGGHGWRADLATVLGQIAEGREFQVRRGAVLLRVCALDSGGQVILGTDPAESGENHLLSLPECR